MVRKFWRAAAVVVAAALATAGCALPSNSPGSQLEANSTATRTERLSAAIDIDPDVLSISTGEARIIVQARPGQLAQAQREIESLGGAMAKPLRLINGFSATVPAGRISDLGALRSVAVVTLDREVHMASSTAGSEPQKSVYRKVLRTDEMERAGYTGAGVTVALIDTGVADLADLSGRVLPVYDDMTGKWSPCANFTGEDCGDSYGHGTFMAGIIAGNGALSGGSYKGVAPGANILSVKIAGRDGSTDVSTVLAAIEWVVSFKDRYNVKVLNLSLGTTGKQTYRTDPMNYAVQEAWEHGIAVVVAASNLGPEAGTVSKPADDPWVITVGATDDRGTPGLGDDALPDFSAHGPTAADGLAKPDLVAPGAHVVSLRAPGSAIESIPSAMADAHYRRGSGTSMSTAAVSGSIALMLQAKPAMTPDRVKYALMATARNAASNDPMAVGEGVVDAYAATFNAPLGVANVGLARSNGLGLLDASRGEVYVTADDPLLTLVNASLTLQLLVWDPITYTGVEWSSGKWYSGKWYSGKWYSGKWYSGKWYSGKWYSGKWYGQEQPANYGEPAPGAAWLGVWG